MVISKIASMLKSIMNLEVVEMNKNRLLFWIPRVLCIAYILFISLFAFDAFSEKVTVSESILAFLIHLIPTAILLVALIISWKWEWIGGILFIIFPAIYLTVARGQSFLTYLIICTPLVLISVLFFVSWFLQNKKYRK